MTGQVGTPALGCPPHTHTAMPSTATSSTAMPTIAIPIHSNAHSQQCPLATMPSTAMPTGSNAQTSLKPLLSRQSASPASGLALRWLTTASAARSVSLCGLSCEMVAGPHSPAKPVDTEEARVLVTCSLPRRGRQGGSASSRPVSCLAQSHPRSPGSDDSPLQGHWSILGCPAFPALTPRFPVGEDLPKGSHGDRFLHLICPQVCDSASKAGRGSNLSSSDCPPPWSQQPQEHSREALGDPR